MKQYLSVGITTFTTALAKICKGIRWKNHKGHAIYPMFTKMKEQNETNIGNARWNSTIERAEKESQQNTPSPNPPHSPCCLPTDRTREGGHCHTASHSHVASSPGRWKADRRAVEAERALPELVGCRQGAGEWGLLSPIPISFQTLEHLCLLIVGEVRTTYHGLCYQYLADLTLESSEGSLPIFAIHEGHKATITPPGPLLFRTWPHDLHTGKWPITAKDLTQLLLSHLEQNSLTVKCYFLSQRKQ